MQYLQDMFILEKLYKLIFLNHFYLPIEFHVVGSPHHAIVRLNMKDCEILEAKLFCKVEEG